MIGKRGNNIKLRYEEIKAYIESFGEELISTEYINAHTKLEIVCYNNHIYYMTWNNFHQGTRCKKCKYEKLGKVKRLKLKDIKIETEILAEGYICKATKYKNVETKIPFYCDKKHKFWMGWHSFKGGQRCPVCKQIKLSREGHPNWKGGVKEKNIPLYATYSHKLSWFEKTRRDPKNKDYLQVKCTNSDCKKWFVPKADNVGNRIYIANNVGKFGEARFYCSDTCKKDCSIFGQKKYPKKFKNIYKRPNQRDWADMVKERDNYTCQVCDKKGTVAHHYEGLNVNPIMSADISMGITLCKKCHRIAHSDIGCRPSDLRKESLCNA